MFKHLLSADGPYLRWILVIVLSMIWGLTFLGVSITLETFPPEQILAVRASIAALVLLPFSLPIITKVPKAAWAGLIGFAITGNAPTYLYAIAQTEISSSLSSIINALTPLTTLVVGVLFYRAKIFRIQLMGILVGLAGTLVLILWDPKAGIGVINAFILFGVLATLANGFSTNIIKFNIKGLTPLQIAGITFLMLMPFALIYLSTTDFFSNFHRSPLHLRNTGILALLGIFANGLALAMVSRLIQISDPVFASLITYLIPVVALAVGFLYGDRLNPVQWGATAIIILSVYLVNRAK